MVSFQIIVENKKHGFYITLRPKELLPKSTNIYTFFRACVRKRTQKFIITKKGIETKYKKIPYNIIDSIFASPQRDPLTKDKDETITGFCSVGPLHGINAIADIITWNTSNTQHFPEILFMVVVSYGNKKAILAKNLQQNTANTLLKCIEYYAYACSTH